MTTNPFYNALCALAYIVGIVCLIGFGTSVFQDQEDTILMPMIMISALVLSVALMAYLFFYQPVIMLLDGRREEALKLFIQTISIFAAGVAVLIAVSLIPRLFA